YVMMLRPAPRSTPFPYTTLFRSNGGKRHRGVEGLVLEGKALRAGSDAARCALGTLGAHDCRWLYRGDLPVGGFIGAGASPDIEKDRKSTRLNSSHLVISYAVFCL